MLDHIGLKAGWRCLDLGCGAMGILGPYTGRFFRKGASEVGCVILSAAKDLRLARREILRCAQDDSLWRPARFKKPTRVRTFMVARVKGMY